MAACGTPSPPLPPQFPRDLRAAPTLPGLANPPLEGVRLARLSSVHRVKRSVCPKEPVNTSLSDLLHSTANVKPHYTPPEWSPRPNFHQWSQSLVPVEHCGVPFDAKPPHFWLAAEGFVPDCVRHKAKKLWHSFFEFAQIYTSILFYITRQREISPGISSLSHEDNFYEPKEYSCKILLFQVLS